MGKTEFSSTAKNIPNPYLIGKKRKENELKAWFPYLSCIRETPYNEVHQQAVRKFSHVVQSPDQSLLSVNLRQHHILQYQPGTRQPLSGLAPLVLCLLCSVSTMCKKCKEKICLMLYSNSQASTSLEIKSDDLSYSNEQPPLIHAPSLFFMV